MVCGVVLGSHTCLRASGVRKEVYEFLSGEITALATATMLLLSKAVVGCAALTYVSPHNQSEGMYVCCRADRRVDLKSLVEVSTLERIAAPLVTCDFNFVAR